MAMNVTVLARQVFNDGDKLRNTLRTLQETPDATRGGMPAQHVLCDASHLAESLMVLARHGEESLKVQQGNLSVLYGALRYIAELPE